MSATPKCFEPRSVPMSVFVPHIDAAFSFEEIAYQFEEHFHIGTLDRIEAVPKVNQRDGHPYNACYLYFASWGNSYMAQNLQFALMLNKQTKLYVCANLFWVVCNNTSVVHEENIPFPLHFSVLMFSNQPNTLADAIEYFKECDLGEVNLDCTQYILDVPEEDVSTVNYGLNAIVNRLESAEDAGSKALYKSFVDTVNCPRNVAVIDFDYWYHSKNAHAFQQVLLETGVLVMPGHITEDMRWTFMPLYRSATYGSNPYIWISPKQYAMKKYDCSMNLNM